MPVRKEIGGAPRVTRTVESEEALLNAFEEDGTRRVREVARQVGISSNSVYEILENDRRHPYHYTHVQHLQPDYPSRVEFCTWLLNQFALNSNLFLPILFSDESMFGRHGSYNTLNRHIWAGENLRAAFPRAFQRRYSVNLWTGLLGDRVVGSFEFPACLTGQIYEEFIETELPHLLDDTPFPFRVNEWFQHSNK